MKANTYLIAAAVALAAPGAANAELLYGLVGSSNSIVTFDSAAPNTITSSLAISGLAAGTTLLGLDTRPANGQLYSISTSGVIYSLTNIGSAYLATAASTSSATPTGTSFGIDFNPVPDRMRLISDTGQNLRINVDNGVAVIDGAINRAGGGAAPTIVGSAYTNSIAGATTTTLYGIDSSTGTLVTTGAPNAGTYSSVGSLGIANADYSTTGFDISARTGIAYLSLGGNGLYTVNLATGATSLVGTVGGGQLTGLTAAAVPEPATWGMMILGFGLIGAAVRRRRTMAFA